MLDPDEKLYELLLTEKDLADKQIGGYGDLSLKVLAFFGGTVAVLGWLYSEKGIGSSHSVAAAVICLAVVVLGCAVILQGITTYGFTLGYIQYKHDTLNRSFVGVANITKQYPFEHARVWWGSEARKPVLLATLGFVALHALLSLGLIVFAVVQFLCHCAYWYLLLTFLALGVLGFTFYVEYSLYVAIKHVFHIQESLPPLGTQGTDIFRAG